MQAERSSHENNTQQETDNLVINTRDRTTDETMFLLGGNTVKNAETEYEASQCDDVGHEVVFAQLGW